MYGKEHWTLGQTTCVNGSSFLWGKLINYLISLDFSLLICEEKDLNEIHYLKMSQML